MQTKATNQQSSGGRNDNYDRTVSRIDEYHGRPAFIDQAVYRDTGDVGITIGHAVLDTETVLPRINGILPVSLYEHLEG